MFQLWASRQVWDITSTNLLCSKWDNKKVSPRCPSCRRWNETSGHILLCREKGRTKFWQTLVDLLERWLMDSSKDLVIWQAVVVFAREWAGWSMTDVLQDLEAE